MYQASTMDTPLCNRGPNHKNLPIMMICLEKGCSRKRMCCLSCIDELHVKHQLVSLKKFYSHIEQITNYNLNVKNKEQIIKLLSLTQNSIKENLQKVKSAFNNKVQQLVKKSEIHFESIKESFIREKLEDVSSKIKGQFTDEKVQQYYQLIKKSQGNLSRSFEELQKLVNLSEKNLKEKVTNYMKQLDKHNDIIAKQILNFKIAKTSGSKTQFGATTKSPYIQLGENGKTVKRIEGSGGYPIAVVNHQFTTDNPTVAFKILEQPGAKGIWMGVCVLDIVKGLNYQSCYGIGKGTWGIDQVGQNHQSAYSWSHHDPGYNSAPKVGWQFWIGDVVEITVDFEKSVARFTKNKQLNYQQPIKLDLGPIYAFAGCTHINDIISLA